MINREQASFGLVIAGRSGGQDAEQRLIDGGRGADAELRRGDR
jgi:hypothetical protein